MTSNEFPAHWQVIPLANAVDALIDYRGKTPKKTDSGIPLITAKIVKGGALAPATEFIAEEDYDSWMVRGLPEVGDVVVTTEAPLGEVAQLSDANVALAQRIVTLRGAQDLLINDYLRYVMQGTYVQGQLESRASGSTVKGIKQSELRKVLIPIPPLQEQAAIAACSKSIDDKIQLNHQINQTLEQIAQAIFKSWFVDFEPVKAKMAAKESWQALQAEGEAETLPDLETWMNLAAMQVISGQTEEALNQMADQQPEQFSVLFKTAALFPAAMQDSELGEIPEGWRSGSLCDICDFQNGYAFKSKDWSESGFAVVKIGSVKPAFVDIQTCSYVEDKTIAGLERFELFSGDILVGMTGYPGETGLVPKTSNRVFLNQRVGRLKPKQSKLKALLYCNVREPDFKRYVEGQSHGSAQANVSGKAVGQYPITIPTSPIVDKFAALIDSLIQQKLNLNAEAASLAITRDTLLPKLLSGELSVADLELVGEA